MNTRLTAYLIALLIVVAGITGLLASIATANTSPTLANTKTSQSSPAFLADSPISPTHPVKLIFIHHSTGGNWLADIGAHDQAGGLGQALMDNNYFVSATNYGWGPDSIGDSTDIPDWPEWFTDTIMSAVYSETGQYFQDYGTWPRLDTDPGGENEIIMFKSCFPNSDLYGNPDDPPRSEPNDQYTVENAKAVYNHILTYFTAHQDKLFIVIAAPPLMDSETTLERAINARAFNNWLMNDWLTGYPHNNVAVFDYYNVLTSNGGDVNTNDVGAETGNHHRWWNSAVQHITNLDNNYSAYPSGDSHPTTAGHQKATAEFLPLLNVFYNRWKSGGTTCEAISDAGITGPTYGYTDTMYTFTAVVTPTSATPPITYTWSPPPDVGADAIVSYTWATTGTKIITVTAENCGGSETITHTITIKTRRQYDIYLPLVLRNYAPCRRLTGVTINGPTSGTLVAHTFTADVTPSNATTPIAYDWSPEPDSGQGTSSVSYQWITTGTHTIILTATNCVPPSAVAVSDTHTITINATGAGLVQPGDLVYQGAFRLPGVSEKPLTFMYGGNAMTFNPDGHITNTDRFSGSLFIMGHDRQAYGDLADGSQVAEISIPEPVISSSLEALPYAAFIQGFSNVAVGFFTNLEEIPKTGMHYLDHSDTGPKIHLAWGQHLQPPDVASHAWFDPNLTAPDMQGVWFIGNQNLYSTNGYIFGIPTTWADTRVEGRYLATGRMRDGGQGGMGPTIFAYRPWLPDGSSPVSGTHLAETTLLLYENAYVTEAITRCMNGYQHADEWEGGAWLTTDSDKSAVLFAGTKSNGTKYWYGYINPAGPEYPCVDDNVTDFVTCRLADGTSCPPEDFTGCCDEGVGDCVTYRGWWSTRFDAQFILYDPADLADVAEGTMESWEPQPYDSLDIDEHLYFNPVGTDQEMLGTGIQRRYRIGAVAFDRDNGFLYVLELFADEAKPVVHVWQVES